MVAGRLGKSRRFRSGRWLYKREEMTNLQRNQREDNSKRMKTTKSHYGKKLKRIHPPVELNEIFRPQGYPCQ